MSHISGALVPGLAGYLSDTCRVQSVSSVLCGELTDSKVRHKQRSYNDI